MDFQKKYHLTQLPNKSITAIWSRGFRNIELFYEDKLIASHPGGNQLKKGVRLQTSDFGDIELILSKEPMTLDLIVGGYHCTNNISHPVNKLKAASTFFWIIAVFAVLGSLLEGLSIGLSPLGTIITIINIAIITIYVIAAVFTAKSQPWAFYLGFSLYALMTAFSLLALLDFSIFTLLPLIVRFVLLYFLITNIKYVVELTKHNSIMKQRIVKENLLDEGI